MLYTRQINQEDASRSEYTDPYFWKVIKASRLDNRSIMGVVSMDGKLIIMSIVQRVNVPTANTSPTMVRSFSASSLKAVLKSPVGSKGSRHSSLDKVPCIYYVSEILGVFLALPWITLCFVLEI